MGNRQKGNEEKGGIKERGNTKKDLLLLRVPGVDRVIDQTALMDRLKEVISFKDDGEAQDFLARLLELRRYAHLIVKEPWGTADSETLLAIYEGFKRIRDEHTRGNDGKR